LVFTLLNLDLKFKKKRCSKILLNRGEKWYLRRARVGIKQLLFIQSDEESLTCRLRLSCLYRAAAVVHLDLKDSNLAELKSTNAMRLHPGYVFYLKNSNSLDLCRARHLNYIGALGDHR